MRLTRILAYTIACLSFLSPLFTNGQDIPVGTWRAHLPYQNVNSVDIRDGEIICGSSAGMFEFLPSENSFTRYNRVDGLSEQFINVVRFDESNDRLIIAYSNANIDIVEGGSITNFPSIKNSSFLGEKRINDIFFDGNTAYVSASFGISAVDFENRIVNETFTLSDDDPVYVNGFTKAFNLFFAATENGIYTANSNNPSLFNFANWNLLGVDVNLPPTEAVDVEFLNAENKVYAAFENMIYESQDGLNWTLFYVSEQDWKIKSLRVDENQMAVCEWLDANGMTKGRVKWFKNNEETTLEFDAMRRPQDVIFTNDILWVADQWNGLIKIENNNPFPFSPNGPQATDVFDMTIDGTDRVWVAAGSATTNYTSELTYNDKGFYFFDNINWKNESKYSLPQISDVFDVISVAVNPQSGKAFLGSHGFGFFSYQNGFVERYDSGNSSIETNSSGQYRITGLDYDADNNLWISNFNAPFPIKVLTNEGDWLGFKPDINLSTNTFTKVLATSYNQIWFVVHKTGILVYDYGDDLNSTADDQYRFLTQTAGNGGLPSNEVFAMAEDKDGEIWIGTNEGVAIFFCPFDLFTERNCDAFQPKINIGGFIAPLLESDLITSIVVDDADRKWIGTENGVWLLSDDGEEVIYNFTEENSPLLNNDIKDIEINRKTGEVFFGTASGIISYRSTATEGADNFDDVKIFPNPVQPEYDGLITISGLLDEAFVKITDISGNLVLDGRALGGQMVWDGKDYTGRRVQSGYYVVFSTSFDGTKNYEGKILFLH